MSTSLEMASAARDLLCAIAGPRGWNDTRESWLAGAARKLGFGYRRTRAIFYGEARIIRAEEWQRLNDEFAALNASAERRRGMLDELEILARSGPAAGGAHLRPLGVGARQPGEAGPRAKRNAG